MSDRRRKAPKIAWRELQGEQDAAAGPNPAPPVRPTADVAPVAMSPTRAMPDAAGAESAHPDADPSSPVALAARLDDAYAAMMAETEREQHAVAAPGTAVAGGPPPESKIALTPVAAVTASAHRASTAPASAPTAEAEVRRILARLATYLPVPRAAPATVSWSAVADAATPVVPRGPAPLDDADVAPLVGPSALRDAARLRRGRVELLLFRAGGELFALPLGAVEEAIEAPVIQTLPEMPTAMLGVFDLRERLVPTYSPGPSLGVGLAAPTGAALLVRSGARRLALAADDVEDVMELDLSTLRDPPVVEDTDGILLGVARFGRDLVGVLDADALISACLGGRNVENP